MLLMDSLLAIYFPSCITLFIFILSSLNPAMQYTDNKMGNARNILCHQIFSVMSKKSLNPNSYFIANFPKFL